jgi:hypothetical protein
MVSSFGIPVVISTVISDYRISFSVRTLKGQNLEKAGGIRVWNVSLGPNQEQLLVFKFF